MAYLTQKIMNKMASQFRATSSGGKACQVEPNKQCSGPDDGVATPRALWGGSVAPFAQASTVLPGPVHAALGGNDKTMRVLRGLFRYRPGWRRYAWCLLALVWVAVLFRTVDRFPEAPLSFGVESRWLILVPLAAIAAHVAYPSLGTWLCPFLLYVVAGCKAISTSVITAIDLYPDKSDLQSSGLSMLIVVAPIMTGGLLLWWLRPKKNNDEIAP